MGCYPASKKIGWKIPGRAHAGLGPMVGRQFRCYSDATGSQRVYPSHPAALAQINTMFIFISIFAALALLVAWDIAANDSNPS